MMLEDQLKKHWYFQYTGAYSVKKKTRSIIESINYTIELLEQVGNMVLMFPQGKIHSMYRDSINFEKGIERVLENISKESQVLFVVNLPEYLSNMKPNLYIYYKKLLAKEVLSIGVENAYNAFYQEVMNIQKMKVS